MKKSINNRSSIDQSVNQSINPLVSFEDKQGIKMPQN